eukprot:1039052-Pleurochrysis_carterae.AAC.1
MPIACEESTLKLREKCASGMQRELISEVILPSSRPHGRLARRLARRPSLDSTRLGMTPWPRGATGAHLL